MKKLSAEQQEGFLFAIVLLIGMLLMLIAGQFALQIPSTWQISDINMDSKLNPNEVYALYREDYDFRLAPIRTDIPNLLATRATATLNSGSPPLAVEFKAPGQIETTTPFQFSAATAATPSVTVLPTSSETPTPTLTQSQTSSPTSTASRTATRTAKRTRTQTTTATLTGTATPSTTATSTSTALPTITITPTNTAVPVTPATLTSTAEPVTTATPTPTATATDTSTPTATLTDPPPSNCIITGSNNYVIPVGGCTASYDTAAQGAIFTLDMVGSGSLSVSWFGLLENQTAGTCAAQSSNLTPGKSLANIAVTKTTTTVITFNNSTTKAIAVQITVSDWTVGGCQ